jgi:multidrug transporter EmrE-like cation transporter
MWFRWMMAAFLFNGVCTFGIRILAGHGLATTYASTYLFLWYLAGALLLVLLRAGGRLYGRKSPSPGWVDLAVGGGLGAASVIGQTCMTLSLGQGLPGAIVFPLALGGGLFVVVGAGVLLFKEPVGPYGFAGIALGVVSIVLLSL